MGIHGNQQEILGFMLKKALQRHPSPRCLESLITKFWHIWTYKWTTTQYVPITSSNAICPIHSQIFQNISLIAAAFLSRGPNSTEMK